jgi:hypothetical protein
MSTTDVDRARESHDQMTRMYAAAKANDMAGTARVGVYQPCSVTPAAPSFWSPISLGTTTDKHGRPRRLEVSHQ